MQKKIRTLKTAYRAGDRAALISAARALVRYRKAHPEMPLAGDAGAIVELARKIAAAV